MVLEDGGVAKPSLKNKMTSRDRGVFNGKKKVVEALRKQRELADDTGLPNFDIDDIDTVIDMDEDQLLALEPEEQWKAMARLAEAERNLIPSSLLPQATEAITGSTAASSMLAPPPCAAQQRKEAEAAEAQRKENAEKALAQQLLDTEMANQRLLQNAATLGAGVDLKRKHEEDLLRQQQEQQVLAKHNQMMRDDPTYKLQMELVLKNAGFVPPQPKSAGSGASPNTPTGLPQKPAMAKGANLEIRGARLAQPQLSESDLAEHSDTSLESEPTAQEAWSLAQRSATTARTALDVANQSMASHWVRMACFLPKGWLPEWLSSEIARWRANGWLSLAEGVAGANERGTPAVLFLSDASPDVFWSAQQAMNWCSGGLIRTVQISPKEISQQEFQFRDWLKMLSDAYEEVSDPQTERAQFVLCRPRRRPLAARDDAMCSSDWWSMGVWNPRNSCAAEEDVVIRCEYNHHSMRMAYIISYHALAYLKLPRIRIEEFLNKECHTYYVWDLRITKDKLSHTRDITKDKIGDAKVSPTDLAATVADAWQNAKLGKAGGDAWSSYSKPDWSDGGKSAGKPWGGKSKGKGSGKYNGKKGKSKGEGWGDSGSSWDGGKSGGKWGKSGKKSKW